MDTYPRRFVEAAFCYLALGVLLGLYMALFPITRVVLFGHVHLLLLGFMSMSVFGIGYHILPRFNNRPLRWPGLVPVHFGLAQVGLVGMILTSPGTGLPVSLFWLACVIEVLSIFLFVANIQTVLFAGKRAAGAATGEALAIGLGSIVGDVLARYPGARDYFVSQGFASLKNPTHGGAGGPRVSIEQACRRHGKDPRVFLTGLRNHLGLSLAGESGKKGGERRLCGPEDRIGELVERYPQAREVFVRYYGEGCFSCAGQAYETVAETAAMHGVKLEEILLDLNRVIQRSS